MAALSLLMQCRHDNMGTRPLGHWVNANLHPILVAGYNQIKLIGYIALSLSIIQIAYRQVENELLLSDFNFPSFLVTFLSAGNPDLYLKYDFPAEQTAQCNQCTSQWPHCRQHRTIHLKL